MGLAMLCVLAGHCYLSEVLPGHLYAALSIVMYGFFTQGFLLLSGLGLYVSFSKNPNIKEFYKRRIWRVLIPYLIIATPYFIFTDIYAHHDALAFVAHETTLAFFFQGNFSGMWYIAASLFLYAIYPFVHKFLFDHKHTELRLLILVTMILVVTLSLYRYCPDYYELIRIGLDRVSVFFVGAYIMYMSYKRQSINMLIGGGILLFAILSWRFSGSSELMLLLSMIFLPLALAIIFGYVFKWVSQVRPLTIINNVFSWLGKYSLEIYIIHLLVFNLLKDYVLTNTTEQICMVIGEATALVLCLPVHRVVDVTISNIRKNVNYDK